VERKIVVGRQDVRQPGPHPIVDRIDDPPGNIGGHRNRTEHDQAGEEPGAEPLAERTVEGRRKRIGHHDLKPLRLCRMTVRLAPCKANAKRSTPALSATKRE
jgi:hypothetical protein